MSRGKLLLVLGLPLVFLLGLGGFMLLESRMEDQLAEEVERIRLSGAPLTLSGFELPKIPSEENGYELLKPVLDGITAGTSALAFDSWVYSGTDGISGKLRAFLERSPGTPPTEGELAHLLAWAAAAKGELEALGQSCDRPAWRITECGRPLRPGLTIPYIELVLAQAAFAASIAVSIHEGRYEDALVDLERSFHLGEVTLAHPVLLHFGLWLSALGLTMNRVEELVASAPATLDLGVLLPYLEPESVQPNFLRAMQGDRAGFLETFGLVDGDQLVRPVGSKPTIHVLRWGPLMTFTVRDILYDHGDRIRLIEATPASDFGALTFPPPPETSWRPGSELRRAMSPQIESKLLTAQAMQLKLKDLRRRLEQREAD